ncbi:conserved repeat domain-containing protein/fimbrial isopeptide formation D2 domain-containing protein, partial [Aquimonas voraii]
MAPVTCLRLPALTRAEPSSSSRRSSVSPWLVGVAMALGLPGLAGADPFPPAWGPANEPGGPVHFAPVPWPNEPANPADCGLTCGDWKPYSRFQNSLNDPRVRDPSNGGTSPQNYVNVASSCIDTSFPSIYYNLRQGAAPDGSQDVILFRWRVEQIANTYATGPNPGNFGATDPWNSALWTVFFDIDGDGFRDLAAHLNGSSGSPSEPVDMIAGIWGDIPTQSLDYLNDPNIKLIAHNPTAFVSGSRILNFQNSLNPTTDWGSAPRSVWDYGTTRSRLVSTNACNEYFIDYQIPVRMLDASPTGPNPALNGPKITRSTPISMMFCSANSLNNPTQKDCAVNNTYTSSTPVTGPFGDYLSFDQDQPYAQPIISSVTATAPNTCPGPYRLSARVQDTLALQGGTVVSSVKAVEFFYWFDANANGEADEAGGRWTRISTAASLQAGSLNTWNANWDATGLPRGAYLVGVQAVDDRARVDLGMSPAPRDNRTFSYATGNAQGQVYINGAWVSPTVQANFPLHQPAQTPVSTEDWYGNPDVTGQQIAIVDVAINACGESPSLGKTATPASIGTGELVSFTVTLANTTSSAITLAQIEDALPPGFQFEATDSLTNDGVALVPTTQPSAGATGTVAWTFPDVSVLPGRSVVLSFQARAGPTAGTYTNVARAQTSSGALDSPPASVGVDAARLSLSKTPDRFAVNPDGSTVVEYSLRWSNDSAVSLTAASITDPLPAGTTYVGCSGGSSCGFSAPNITWELGNLAPGASGEVRLRLTVNTNYASPSLQNTASFSATPPGGGSASTSASSTIAVNVPVPAFTLEKSSSTVQVAPGGSVTWTLTYANYGTGAASGVVLTDDLPEGFSFASCSVAGSTHFSPCSHANGIVTFNAATVPAGGSGSVSITVNVAGAPFPFANPATNSASLTWTGNPTPVQATDTVGVTGQACSAVYYQQAGASFATSTLAVVPPPTSRTGTFVDLWSGQTAVFTGPVLSSPVELANRILAVRIFIDPAANRTVSVTVERVNGGGTASPIASFNQALGNSPQVFTFNTAAFAAGTAPLAVGERLRLTFGANGNASQLVRLFYDGTQLFNGASTYTDSLTSICSASSPAALDVSKRVDQANLTSLPAALQYTIDVSNPGGINATGAVLTDTLPSGVNLVSVVLNGTTVVPTPTVTGQQFSLPVNSVGQASGVIAAGGLGTVVVNATATASASGSLINTASLSASGLGPVVDTATTVVGVPGSGAPAALNLSKSVSPGLLLAGDTATFRLTVVNTGGTAASGVVVSDDFPNQAWFTYLDCTAPAGDTCSESPAGSLLWNVGTLLPGEAASLDFRMRVASSGVPAGANALQNVATVSDPTYCTAPAVSGCTSNTVNLTISGQPRLELDKTASPAGPYAAGDLITYTLVLRNTGASDASGVQVVDPVPAYTAYAGGLSASLGSGSFDAVDNRVVYSLNSLAAGATATLSFQARVVYPLPQGNTSITNTATASAANAASVQDSVTGTAVGAPLLTLDKQGAASVPYPAAILSSAASGTSIVVDSAQRLSVGGYVQVGGSVRRVSAIAGRTVTLDGSVSAAAGAPVAASVEYALVYANEGDADASSVVLTDTLPANLVYAAASVTPTSAPPVGSAGALSFSLGTLEAGEVGQLQINAIPLAAGSYTNAASLSATGVPSVNDSVPTQAGGLVVDKRTITPVRSAGEQAEYVLSVRNTAPGTISGITVTDPLPSGFSYDSTVHVRINGVDVVPLSSPSAGSAFPSWGSFAVPAGQTLEIRFLATVGPDVGPATYDNPLEVSAPGAAITPFDPLATPAEDVTVLASDQGLVFGVIYADIDGDGSYDAAIDTPLPDAEVLVRAANGVVYIAYADFEGRYQRVVPAGSTLVSVAAASLPSGLVPTVGDDGINPNTVLVPTGGSAQDNNGFVPASGPVGNVIGRVFDDPNENGLQDPGDTSRLGVRVELRDPVGGAILFVTYTDLLGDYSFVNVPVGNYTVHVERPSGTGFGTATPNNPTVSVTDGGTAREDFGLIVALTVDADLSVTKSNGASSVVAGGSTTWTLVISNAGPSAADGATVFDPAVAGLSKTAVICSGSSGGASCPPAPDVVALEAGTLAIPTLPVGGTVTLQVTANVTAAAGDTVVNTVSVSPPDGVTDPDPGDNSASDSDPVEAPPAPELTLSKSASPSPFTVGQAASYTLQVSNTGTAATTVAITITDDVPASLALGTLPAGCTASGQTVTCTVASLAVGASSSFVIPVTPGAGAAPSVQNTATVSGGGDPGCPLAARCSSTITTPVNAPGLGFTKTANLGDANSNGTADEGEVIAYTLTATN